MTGFLHEKEFSRKTFVKGGGALIVGLSFAGGAGKAQAAGGVMVQDFGLGSIGRSWRDPHSDHDPS